jgi:hypothetical protein
MLRGEHDPTSRFRFQLPDGQEINDALVLLVGNNEYGQGALETTSRRSLEDGVLQISVLRARTGAQLASMPPPAPGPKQRTPLAGFVGPPRPFASTPLKAVTGIEP